MKTPHPSARLPWKWALAVFAVTLAAFSMCVTFEFLNIDDPRYLTANPNLGDGLSGSTAAWAFRSTYFGWWHPLTWLSHLLDVRLYGFWAGGHHLTSVFIHALSAATLVLTLSQLGLTGWRSVAIALVFALHPLRVESVAWLSERKDVLCTCCSILCVWAYVRYRDAPSRGRYVQVLGSFALAAMSKMTVVTLPVALLWLDAWRGVRQPALLRRALELAPLLAMAVADTAAVTWAQHEEGAVQPLGVTPLSTRLALVPVQWLLYLQRFVLPVNLSFAYQRPAFEAWQLAAAGVVVLAIGVVIVARRLRHLFFGLGWMVCSLMPMVGLVQIGAQFTADRYTSFSQLGVLAALVLMVPRAWAARWWLQGAFVALVVALLSLTQAQLRIWADTRTLLTHVLEREPTNAFAQGAMGLELMAAGDAAGAAPLLERSVHAGYGHLAPTLGQALVDSGQPERGVALLRQLHGAAPNDVEAQRQLSRALAKTGRLAEGLELAVTLAQRLPRNAQAAVEAGELAVRAGEVALAKQWLVEASRRAPLRPDVHALAGTAAARAGDFALATSAFARSLELDSHQDAVKTQLQFAQEDLARATSADAGTVSTDDVNAR